MAFEPPVPFSDEVTDADVVVVGSGGAGLTAALVAAVGGASVVVLEKADQLGGTTALSGGGVWAPLNPHEAEQGVPDSVEDVVAYLRAISDDDADDRLLLAYAHNARAMVEYLETRAGLSFRAYPGRGTTWDYRSEVAGARQGGRGIDSGPVSLEPLGQAWVDLIRMGPQSAWVFDKFVYYADSLHARTPAAGGRPKMAAQDIVVRGPSGRPTEVVANGTALVTQLLRGCLERGVRVFTGVRVRDLVVTDGRVTGVRAEYGGESRPVSARRGVVLATGGFTHNPELVAAHLPGRTIDYTCDVTSNEGDGLTMGVAAGAATAGIGDAWWIPAFLFTDPNNPASTGSMIREDRCLPHTMMVNRQGVRFVNEAMNYYDIVKSFERPGEESNLPAWLIFDSQALARYGVLRNAPWPADGSTPDWLRAAETLSALAGECGLDPEVLERTVAEFNEHADAGVDPLFHRGESPWDLTWGDADHLPNPSLGPVEKGPFYALEVTGGAFSTKGGLRLDDHGRVLGEATGAPIPGLYAAGNVSNCALPGAYPGVGATLGPAMTFGYLIGRELGTDDDND
ncbi:FAD-dependent oxidoreductase [Actinophytocola oryzae]|uniref:Succinate dehydrogenase/fumarate reductase flavoprotein subunit n=1 Tax=Actinophytocola oryzae TaxID=502181 RepID=A0A4R7W189_9PSEU|nr:FAD-dependent oxidoreductase [Actinophytocola oryzae]TDV56224.1 succinate dehydrogenase/fumarate reductase flavoprotein subunit [Actinophytocola oryzae]